jgi:hypothetical protein
MEKIKGLLGNTVKIFSFFPAGGYTPGSGENPVCNKPIIHR